jgi:outer membrane protein OmpA-like peptidoglycan-associated protein
MPLPTSRVLWIGAVVMLIVPPLLGAKGGCKCVKQQPGGDTVDTDAEWQKVRLDRKLQVSRLVPDLVEPNTGFTADVLGAGLQQRASITIGPFDGENVTFHTAARMSVDVPPLPVGRYDLTVTNPDGESVTLARALTVQAQPVATRDCAELVVYFGFDQDILDSAARDAMDPLVTCWQGVSGRIRIEGHADARGTIDYNLALGQRRADAVQRYLMSLAVPVSKLRTVSYGEERPAVTGYSEAAWAKNRRAVIVVED